MNRRIAYWSWLLSALIYLAPRPCLAQDSARADELFTQGRERLASGDFAAACPLLEQSYALDPATGSLLALAMCQEGAGQSRDALRSYREVLTRSEAEKRLDRARVARAKIETLEKRTASLRVDTTAVADQPALQLTLNGEPLPAASQSPLLVLDPGSACVEAAAPQRLPWRECVSLLAGSAQTLVVPALEALPPPAEAPTRKPAKAVQVSPAASARGRSDSSPSLRPPAEWVGIALLSLSGAAFLTSIGFVLRADHQSDLVDLHCRETCSPEADAARAAEQRARDGALISGMVGLGAAVAGVVTYVWGRQQRNARGRPASVAPVISPALAPVISPTLAGASFAGTF